jgi:hypothetical protein
MTPRLDEAPRIGEVLHPVGFGRCPLFEEGVHRREREGGMISGLSGGTIFMKACICPGDSGGPLLSQGSYEVVGVVSMSAMDADPHTSGPSLFARIDAFRGMFANARQIADGVSASELPPLTCDK